MKKALPLIAIGLATALVAGCGGGTSASPGASSTPGVTAPTARADGAAVLPVATNPIANTATAPGLTIAKVLVENNVSPDTGKGVGDHLEILLKNTSAKPLSKVDVYYTFTDAAKGISEGYYAKLTGLVIDPGATRVVNFDTVAGKDTYPVNKYSMYYTNKNALVVEVMASAAGVKPAMFSVKKDAGGAEAGVE